MLIINIFWATIEILKFIIQGFGQKSKRLMGKIKILIYIEIVCWLFSNFKYFEQTHGYKL